MEEVIEIRRVVGDWIRVAEIGPSITTPEKGRKGVLLRKIGVSGGWHRVRRSRTGKNSRCLAME